MEEEERQEKMSLVNIHGGAIVETFDNCLDDVLENMADINTTEKERTITLKVKLKPLEGRTIFVAEFSCSTALQGQEPVKFTGDLKIDKNADRYFAFERGKIKRQGTLPFKPRVAE